MTRCAPVGSWLSTALHAAMPDANDTARPPSSPPRSSSKASQVAVASVRLYRRSVPSTKFDAGTSGVFRGAPGTRSGRPPTMAQVSGFIATGKSPSSAPRSSRSLPANLAAPGRVFPRMRPFPHLSRRHALRATLAGALAAGALAPAAASATPVCPPAGTPYVYGANCRTIDVDGYPRQFIVYYTERFVEHGGRAVVVMYHGSGETGEYFLRMSGWRRLADSTGLIAVFPTGLHYRDLDTLDPTTKWNDG